MAMLERCSCWSTQRDKRKESQLFLDSTTQFSFYQNKSIDCKHEKVFYISVQLCRIHVEFHMSVRTEFFSLWADLINERMLSSGHLKTGTSVAWFYIVFFGDGYFSSWRNNLVGWSLCGRLNLVMLLKVESAIVEKIC